MRTAAGALVFALLAGPATAQETPYRPLTLPEPGAGVCPGGMCRAEALSRVFASLLATERGERREPVHILQLGDSHTAGDRITGKVRAMLQARFGAAGRGVLPPGVPYPGYAPHGVEVLADGWRTELAPLGGGGAASGLTSARGRAAADAALTLRFEAGAAPALFGVCGWALGDGYGLRVEPGGLPWRLNLNWPEGRPHTCQEVRLDQPTDMLRLGGLEAGVTLDALWTETGRPGVILSNLGVVGATLRDLAARDPVAVRNQLAAWSPDLIVLAFGTNEGFEDGLDGPAYARLLRDEIERLRRDSDGADILILGAPDALRGGSENGCSADGRRKPPPSLALVRDMQRRVAEETGVAYWDWHGRMGGDCSADRLATAPDPLMRGDRVHFTNVGADWIGGVLAGDLMAAYEAWKAGRG